MEEYALVSPMVTDEIKRGNAGGWPEALTSAHTSGSSETSTKKIPAVKDDPPPALGNRSEPGQHQACVLQLGTNNATRRKRRARPALIRAAVSSATAAVMCRH